MEGDVPDTIIPAGIGAGLFLLITTYLLAFVLFGRLTGFASVLLVGELLFTLGLIIIFSRRKLPWKALRRPVTAAILLSVMIIGMTIVFGTTLIHAPLPSPDSPAWSSGTRVISMAVRTDEISTTSPEATELLISGLTIASRNNQFAEAIPYYDQALALDPGFIEAWMAKGIALHNLGSYAEAVDCLDRAISLDPENAVAWSLKGYILESWGRSSDAAVCHARAAELTGSSQSTPAVTVPPTAPPAIITPNESNVQSYESSPPPHPPMMPDAVPWNELTPATPLPASEILNLVFSLEWLNANDMNPDPQIFNVTMTAEEFVSSFAPDPENPLISRHREVEDDRPVALLNMPKTMFAYFQDDPSMVKVNFPDSFFRFYDSMDALCHDLQDRQRSNGMTNQDGVQTSQTIPSPVQTTPRIYS